MAKSDGKAKSKPAKPKAKPAKSPKPKQLPPYNVILLNDDDHTYDYVIVMLADLFGHSPEMGYSIAQTVDSQGRAIVMTTHRELAELKRDQILGYGADFRISRSRGSMSAVIEPAPQ